MSQKKTKEFSGRLGDLSENQSSVLKTVRKHLNDRNIYDTRYDDWMLLRFCRVKKFKVSDIISMIDKEIHFREIHDLDHFFDHYDHRIDEFMKKNLTAGYSGISKEGYPINIEILANFDLQVISEQGTKEDNIMFNCKNQEKLLNVVLPYCSFLADKRIDQQITIVDLKGFNYMPGIWNKSYREGPALASEVVNNNYPDTSYKIFIINTPFAFSALWAIMKKVLPESHVKKIRVLGSSYKKELQKDIDADQLPSLLGGTVANFPDNKMPWSEYLDYCYTKKTWYPIRQARFSDPLKIVEFNPMKPDEIDNQLMMSYNFGYSERSMNYDQNVEEHVSGIKVPKMHIVNEGGLTLRKQIREFDWNDLSKTEPIGLTIQTLKIIKEGGFIPFNKASNNGCT